MPPGHLPEEEALRKTRDAPEGACISTSQETPRGSPAELEDVSVEMEVFYFCQSAFVLRPRLLLTLPSNKTFIPLMVKTRSFNTNPSLVLLQ